MDGEIKLAIERVDDENKRQNERLRQLEEVHRNINDMKVSYTHMEETQKYLVAKVEKIDLRLEKIESDPIDTVKSARETVIKTVIAFVMGIVLAGIFWLVTNHGGI